jgi:hypothetical protein
LAQASSQDEHASPPLILLLLLLLLRLYDESIGRLRVYGGGEDELLEHHGGTSGSFVCPRSSVYRMDKLCVLMPPRGSVLLLGGATSSSIIRGDSEIECLLEELNDGAFDDRVFLGKILVALFHIVVALTHNEYTGGCLLVEKTHKTSIWSDGNYGEFSLLLFS